MDSNPFPYPPTIENSDAKESLKPRKQLRLVITLEPVDEFEFPDHRNLVHPGAARQREEFLDIGSNPTPPDEG